MIARMPHPPRRFGIRGSIAATIAAFALALPLKIAAAGDAKILPVAGCVDIAMPKPGRGYSYRQTQSNGPATEFTDWWESFTKTGSRLLTTPGRSKGSGILTVNKHRIVNDVLILDSSSQTGPGAGGSSWYKPGVVSAPMRACQGRSWPVSGVTVTNRSSQGTFSARSDEGTLKIVAFRESITVPAGKFDTAHYVRNMRTAAGLQLNEYWTSIDHGIVVKRMHTVRGIVITATLQAIK